MPLGILLVVLGGIAVVGAFAATLATVMLFAVLLLAGGIAQLAHALLGDRSEDVAWEVLAAALYTVAGVVLIADPVGGAIGLTLLLAIFFLFVGVLRISLGFRLRRAQGSGGGYWLAGALDLLLGLLILAGWPETGVWVIGLFLGIELIVAGLSMLFVAGGARRRLSAPG